MGSACGSIRRIFFTGIEDSMRWRFAILHLFLLAGHATTDVWAQEVRRLHIDEVQIEGRFLSECVDTTAGGEPIWMPFEGVLFDQWPNGALKLECGVMEGQWNMDCMEWHQNGQLRSQESLDGRHYHWNGWYPSGAVFFRKTFQFDGPAGAFIGVGEALKSVCFAPDGTSMPCPAEIVRNAAFAHSH